MYHLLYISRHSSFTFSDIVMERKYERIYIKSDDDSQRVIKQFKKNTANRNSKPPGFEVV